MEILSQEWLMNDNDWFKLTLLRLDNDTPDVDIVNYDGFDELRTIMKDYFIDTSDVVQIIIKNKEDEDLCGYLRIIMQEYSQRVPINYKLETVLKIAGYPSMSARCRRAIVLGATCNIEADRLTSVPFRYHMTTTDRIVYNQDINIAGINMTLPYEVLLHIVKFCEHPCSTIMKRHNNRIDWFQFFIKEMKEFSTFMVCHHRNTEARSNEVHLTGSMPTMY